MMPDSKKRLGRAAVTVAVNAVTEPLERRCMLSGGGGLPGSVLAHLWSGYTYAPFTHLMADQGPKAAKVSSGVTTAPSGNVSTAAPRAAAAITDQPSVRELTSPAPRTNTPLDTLVARLCDIR